MLCNEKCPTRTVKDKQEIGYDLYEGSMISIPPGTKFDIYVNEDPDDPMSDTWIETVELTGIEDMDVVLTKRVSVKQT